MTTSKIDESYTPIAMTDSITYLPTKAIVNPLFCFTYMHHLWLSTGVAITLGLLLLVLVSTVAWRKVWLSVFCHLPHLGWVCFASYVTAQMAQLN